jgi:2-keto-4-pentenoate hydratase/2-oxohepta-3-ene-1,7-dioic acid hydratase in catechol pathway
VQLVTYERGGHARVGVREGDEVLDVGASMLELLRSGDLAHAGGSGGPRHPLAEVRLLAPLPRPNSIRDFMLVEEHVRNSLGSVPDEWYEIPVYWKGNCDAVLGPDDEVPWPHYTDKLDYELEVAAVIGRRVRNADLEEAERAIAGYTIFNDWSARDIQFREMKVGLGPGLGKDFATSMGPCLTTADAIDIASVRMSARVNGEVWSEGTLGAMRFSFPEVIVHLSKEQTLQPGDVLGSGTVGRGCGLELDRWIAPGDVVELEVEGIGTLRSGVGAKRREEIRT